MPVSGITLRLTKGSPLSSAEGDQNFVVLRNAINALQQLFGVSLNPDGTLKAGALNNVNQITDGLITAVKLAADAVVPIGSIIFTPVATVPTNYLEADGSSLLRATYVSLFALYGTTFGAADGSHFNIVDLRGLFLMGRSASHVINTTGGADSVMLATANIPNLEPEVYDPTDTGANAPYRPVGMQHGAGASFSLDGSDAVNPRNGAAQTAASILNPYRTGLWLIKAL